MGAGLELRRVGLGANRVANGEALCVALAQNRRELHVDWEAKLHGAKPFVVVGAVFDASPAHAAGLAKGDRVLAWGAVQHAEFVSVAETISPMVKASEGKPLSVVVARPGQAEHVALALTPREWSGKGLLGCGIKAT
jgi:S1-C subfamily serine protease